MTEHNHTQRAPGDEERQRLLDLPALDDQARGWMLATLPRTSDARTRNSVALKLAESGVREAIPILTRLLEMPETAGNRGTLLYSLDELGAKLEPKHLLHLMMTDTYEVQTQAFEMLENAVNDVSPGDLRIMLDWVLATAPKLDPRHREAAAVASELLVRTLIERSALPAATAE